MEVRMTRMGDGVRHLSRGMERRWKEVERADEIIGKIDRDVLADLQRRREATAQPDGFKSGNYGSGAESTSTESAALSGLPGADDQETDDWSKHQRPDYVGQCIEHAIEQLDIATRALREYDRYLQPVIHAGDIKQGRRSSIGVCQACGRDVPGTENDRLKSGYCIYVSDPTVEWSGCYERFIRADRPDRPYFETAIRAQRAEHLLTLTRTGYGVDELDHLVATGVLPGGKAA